MSSNQLCPILCIFEKYLATIVKAPHKHVILRSLRGLLRLQAEPQMLIGLNAPVDKILFHIQRCRSACSASPPSSCTTFWKKLRTQFIYFCVKWKKTFDKTIVESEKEAMPNLLKKVILDERNSRLRLGERNRKVWKSGCVLFFF